MGRRRSRADGSDAEQPGRTNTLGARRAPVDVVLLPALGMHRSFFVLMLGSVMLASGALRLAAGSSAAGSEFGGDEPVDSRPDVIPHPPSTWAWLAAVSGFNVLGLEILALHLFSQVLHNSSYTFATVLVVVIASLAVGALFTQRWRLEPAAALQRIGIALLATALATALVPRVFFGLTRGMQPLVAVSRHWRLRPARVGVAALVLGPCLRRAGIRWY
jgi:hypothetical protein